MGRIGCFAESVTSIVSAAEAAELEIRSIEDRSTNYWLLQHLAKEKMDQALKAIVLDQKGNIELEDYYLRGKLSGPPGAPPGAVIEVVIETIDPLKGESRFRSRN